MLRVSELGASNSFYRDGRGTSERRRRTPSKRAAHIGVHGPRVRWDGRIADMALRHRSFW